MKMQGLALPGHIVFFYDCLAGEVQATRHPGAADVLVFRLTGRVRELIDDPNRQVSAASRLIELDAPTAHRGGHPGISVRVEIVSDSRILCVIPKTELSKLMGPTEVERYLKYPSYEIFLSIDTNPSRDD